MLAKFLWMSDILFKKSSVPYGLKGNVFSEGRSLDVCREDNLGDTSDRWVHNVYPVILFLLIGYDFFRKDHLLQKTVKEKKIRIYDPHQKGTEKWGYGDSDGNM